MKQKKSSKTLERTSSIIRLLISLSLLSISILTLLFIVEIFDEPDWDTKPAIIESITKNEDNNYYNVRIILKNDYEKMNLQNHHDIEIIEKKLANSLKVGDEILVRIYTHNTIISRILGTSYTLYAIVPPNMSH